MNELNEMSKEELLEVIRIKNIIISELREEIENYKQLTNDLIAEKAKKVK